MTGGAVYRTSNFQEDAGRRVPKGCLKWLKGMPNSQGSVEWSAGRQTAIKEPNNQNGKEGSQESARSVPAEVLTTLLWSGHRATSGVKRAFSRQEA